MRAAARRIVGLVLIVTGLIAIPVPVIPGIPLIAAGAAMLGSDHSLVRFGWMWLHKRGVLKHETTQDVCEPERVIVDRQAENDRCPRCRGVWRNQGELVKLMEHSVYQYDCPVPESQHGDRNDEHRRPNYGKKKESFLGEMFDFD